MLDLNFSLEVKPDMTLSRTSQIDGLRIEGCAIHCFADNRLWSDFDDLSYNRLNMNDRGFGVLDIEISFSGYKQKAYPDVYTKCFVLRTDNNLVIKPLKTTNGKSISKINMRGELVVGLRYYFRSEEEIEKLKNCMDLSFEAFLALGSMKNTYAFMCQLVKTNATWEMKEGNTYRLRKYDNIKSLID